MPTHNTIQLYTISPEGVASPTGVFLDHMQDIYIKRGGLPLRWMWLPRRSSKTYTGKMCCVVDTRGTSFGHDGSVAVYSFYDGVKQWWTDVGLICWSVEPERDIQRTEQIRLAAGNKLVQCDQVLTLSSLHGDQTTVGRLVQVLCILSTVW